MNVDELFLARKIVRVLKSHGYTQVEQLVRASDKELQGLQGIGVIALGKIRDVVRVVPAPDGHQNLVILGRSHGKVTACRVRDAVAVAADKAIELGFDPLRAIQPYGELDDAASPIWDYDDSLDAYHDRCELLQDALPAATQGETILLLEVAAQLHVPTGPILEILEST